MALQNEMLTLLWVKRESRSECDEFLITGGARKVVTRVRESNLQGGLWAPSGHPERCLICISLILLRRAWSKLDVQVVVGIKLGDPTKVWVSTLVLEPTLR